MRALGLSTSLMLVLSLAATSAQVKRGELEEWKGYVTASISDKAPLYLLTLSESEGDGMARVGFLMELPPNTKLPEVRGVAEVEYKGEMYVRLTFKSKQKLIFLAKDQIGSSDVPLVVMGRIQRLGFKPKTFMNHSEAAAAVFKSFKAFPGQPTRDKKPQP